MDSTLAGTLLTAAGAVVTVVTLVSRSIGGLRKELSAKMDAQAKSNQEAHDAIGQRIDGLRTELGGRIDAQGASLGGRIDRQGERIDGLAEKVAKTSEDVAFIKGQLIAKGQASAKSED